MYAVNLQSVEFNIESLYYFLKAVVRVSHQLHGLFLIHRLMRVLLWLLMIGEQNEKDSSLRARNFDKVDILRNIMEVSIKHASVRFNTMIIPAHLHRARSLFCNKIWQGLIFVINFILVWLLRIEFSLI